MNLFFAPRLFGHSRPRPASGWTVVLIPSARRSGSTMWVKNICKWQLKELWPFQCYRGLLLYVAQVRFPWFVAAKKRWDRWPCCCHREGQIPIVLSKETSSLLAKTREPENASDQMLCLCWGTDATFWSGGKLGQGLATELEEYSYVTESGRVGRKMSKQTGRPEPSLDIPSFTIVSAIQAIRGLSTAKRNTWRMNIRTP